MPYGSGLSSSMGVATEGTATVGTSATPVAWYEFLDESLTGPPKFLDSMGIRAGQSYKRGARTSISSYDVNGDIILEHADKGFSAATGRGMGFWWYHALGSTTTAAVQVTGSAYKQIHTPGPKVGRSFTVQAGRPQTTGVIFPFTYRGCKISQWEFSCSDGELAKVKFTLDGWKEETTPAFVTPTFPGTGYQAGLFSFADSSTFTLGGTATTSTGANPEITIAGGSSVTTVVKGATITGTTALAVNRFGFGNQGIKREQVENGIPTITGKLSGEFTSETEIYERFIGNQTFPMQLNFTHGSAEGTANPYKLSFIMPMVRFKTATVNTKGADILAQDITFEAYYDETNAPIQVVLVSTDQLI